MRAPFLQASILLLAAGCQMPGASSNPGGPTSGATDSTGAADAAPGAVSIDVPISRAPFDALSANWKHRLDQAYVYVEHVGDYRELGRSVRTLVEAAEAQAMTPAGPLFALFYDDPGEVPAAQLRARICLPVAPGTSPRGALRFDVLDSTPVAYAVTAGAYGETPLSYPALFGYLREHGWQQNGPIRHIYLNPDAARTGGELLTEVQVPWAAAR